jgi:hypothetical protein
MGDVTLSTGKVVSIDTSKFTWGEWRSFFHGNATQKEEDAFIEKATGLKTKEQTELLRDDFRRLVQAILKIGSEPLSPPNSVSESTNS